MVIVIALLSLILVVLVLGRERFSRYAWAITVPALLALPFMLVAVGIARMMGAAPAQVTRTAIVTGAVVYLVAFGVRIALTVAEIFGIDQVAIAGWWAGLTKEQIRHVRAFEKQADAAWERRDFQEFWAIKRKQREWELSEASGTNRQSDDDM